MVGNDLSSPQVLVFVVQQNAAGRRSVPKDLQVMIFVDDDDDDDDAGR